MEVILTQDISKLGHKDEVVRVKDGYARNYLFPQNMAIPATTVNRKNLQETIRQRQHKEQQIREQSLQVLESLKGVLVTVKTKTSESGKIFGSVTNVQISEELRKKGFDIQRKQIEFRGVREVGVYTAKVMLHKDISQEIEVSIESE